MYQQNPMNTELSEVFYITGDLMNLSEYYWRFSDILNTSFVKFFVYARYLIS
jgi:hypothetical protein